MLGIFDEPGTIISLQGSSICLNHLELIIRVANEHGRVAIEDIGHSSVIELAERIRGIRGRGMKGPFAYQCVSLLCGECGMTMMTYYPPTPIDNEYTYRVYCCNRQCSNYLEIYEPGDKIKVSLIPTRLRAADPNMAMTGQAAMIQNQAVLGTAGIGGPTAPPPTPLPDEMRIPANFRVDNPREWTQLTNVEAPRMLTRDEVTNAARELVERNDAVRPR